MTFTQMKNEMELKETMLLNVISSGNHSVGCVVARRVVGGDIKIGWSKCLSKPTVSERNQGVNPDKFNKAKAIAMAKSRTSSKDPFYSLSLDNAEIINQDNAPNIPSIIRKHLRIMAKRARRYFK